MFIIVATHKVKRSSSDLRTLLIIKYLAIIDLLSSVLLYPNFIYLVSVGRYNLPAAYCILLGIWEIYFPTTSTFLVLVLVAFKVHMLRNPFSSLSHNRVLIHVICIATSLSGLIIPSAPVYGLATMIYDPKRQTCTFDFYPDFQTEMAKCIFVSGAVFFCCVAPLASISGLSVYILVKVKRRTKMMAAAMQGGKGENTPKVIIIL